MIYKNVLLKKIEYEVEATSASPFSVKNGEDNLKVDFLTGKVYIPGSSIAGAFRNYYECTINKSSKSDNKLFGGVETGMSKVVFYDAYLTEGNDKKMISSRPGLKIDSKTLTSAIFNDSKESGGKFSRVFVNEGIRFMFKFEINDYGLDNSFNKMEKEFEDLLRAFSAGDIALGSNKMIGFGRFKVESAAKEIFDFTKFKNMVNFLSGKVSDEDKKSIDILNELLNVKHPSSTIRFEIDGKTVTPLLIKDEIIRSSDEPDAINIVNSDGYYVIPGSSIKGVLRSRAERIVRSFPCIDEKVITSVFGEESSDGKGRISKLNCFDVKVENASKGVYNKIKIDHFTGGTIQGALMKEESIMGDIKITCTFNISNIENYERELGLLLLVLRDLCLGDLNLGSGYAVGRGYIKAKTLGMFHAEDSIYDFDSPDMRVEELFNSFISKLMN